MNITQSEYVSHKNLHYGENMSAHVVQEHDCKPGLRRLWLALGGFLTTQKEQNASEDKGGESCSFIPLLEILWTLKRR